MDAEDLLKKADNPDYIPGIYNYCDRWCEKCPFTERCLHNQITAELEKNLGSIDVLNPEFWNKMSTIYNSTQELIQNIIKEKVHDLSKKEKNEILAEIQHDNTIREHAIENPMASNALQYVILTDDFFEKEQAFFQSKEDELNNQLDLGINEQNIEKFATEITENIEIIKWHSEIIYKKIVRALSEYEEEELTKQNNIQSDSDGTAKVASISIEKTFSAWGKLIQLLPEKTDELITILLHLEKLKNELLQQFPHAPEFKRPGFDD